MRAVDTDVLVRAVIRDDARQAESADAFVARGAWISHVVLAETVWVLRAACRLDPHKIAAAVGMLLEHESFTLKDPDVVAAALLRYEQRPALRFTDCLILEIARKGRPRSARNVRQRPRQIRRGRAALATQTADLP